MSNYSNPDVVFASTVDPDGFDHADPVPPCTPSFEVSKGNPSPEELAALTAVVLGLQAGNDVARKPRRSRAWARRRQLRLAPTPGPGAWRRSLR